MKTRNKNTKDLTSGSSSHDTNHNINTRLTFRQCSGIGTGASLSSGLTNDQLFLSNYIIQTIETADLGQSIFFNQN